MTVSGRGSFRAPNGGLRRRSVLRGRGVTGGLRGRTSGRTEQRRPKAEEVREFTCADGLPPSLARLHRLSFLAHFRPKTRAERRVLDSRKISGCECVACQQPVNASPPPFSLNILERQVNMTSPLHWTAAFKPCVFAFDTATFGFCTTVPSSFCGRRIAHAERPLFFSPTRSSHSKH